MWKRNNSSIFTLVSIVLVLCMIGLYGIISLHAGNISNILKENINIIVELEADIPALERQRIINSLKQNDKVKDGTIRSVSPEEAMGIMEVEMEEDFLINPEDNPFSEMILFNVTYENVDNSSLSTLKTSVESLAGVEKLHYYESVYEYLETNVRRIGRILLIIGVVLSFFAFALIYSTIQLSLYAERFKIRTMELVGAEWNQIRKPFTIKSLRLAILASIISLLILSILLIITAVQFAHFGDIINYGFVFLVFIFMFLFAIFITQLASRIVVNRYLGADKNKFF